MDLFYLLHFRLQFTRETQFRFFHHAALYAALLDRLGNPDLLPFGIALYAPERGRVNYAPGDGYNFGIALHPNSPISPARLVELVKSKPKTRFGNTDGAPLGDNYIVADVRDAVAGRSLNTQYNIAMIKPLKLKQLENSAENLARQTEVTINLLSPMFIRRTVDDSGERALMDGDVFYPDKFLTTIADGIGEWLPDAAFTNNLDVKNAKLKSNRLVRTDVSYAKRGFNRKEKKLLGVSGSVTLSFDEGIKGFALPLLIGGIIGASRPTNRRMGQGRYEITGVPLPCEWPPKPDKTILQRAAEPRNIEAARAEIALAGKTPGVDGEGVQEFLDDLTIMTPRFRQSLYDANVKPDSLRGLLIKEKREDGQNEKIRALCIPTLRDRFLQRAVLQELTPALEQLWEESSFAYRPGLSHRDARTALIRAQKDGYRYALDADIRAFFDEVDWNELEKKLTAYFGFDPVVGALMSWVKAPIEFSGVTFNRSKGLPQGAVISPTLANLYLDALDEALERKGVRLIRYADDFIILCKNPQELEVMNDIAKDELAKVRLRLNEEKTKITSFEKGFKFLGALFCRSMAIEREKETDRVVTIIDKMPPDEITLGEIVDMKGWLADYFAAKDADSEKTLQVRRRTAIFPPNPQRRPVYVITGQAKLSAGKKGLFIERENEKMIMVPWNELSEIVVIGGRWMSGSVVQRAVTNKIPIAFHKWDGTPLGLVLPEGVRSPSPVAMLQWEWAKNAENNMAAAKKLVAAKIRNTRLFIRRREEDVSKLMSDLDGVLKCALAAETPDLLRGYEGQAAHAYFSQWNQWVGSGDFGEYPGRISRGANDPINVTLNFLYTQLFRLTHTTIISTGLDPYLGVMHEGRGRYAALASDLMEPFRFLVDRIVLSAVNRRILKRGDFIYSEKGPYQTRLSQEAVKRLIQDFEDIISAEIADKRNIKDSYRGHLYREAMSLRRKIEGAEEDFEAFEMKW